MQDYQDIRLCSGTWNTANLFLQEVAKLDVACSQLEERNCNDLATEVCKTIVTGLTQKVTIF